MQIREVDKWKTAFQIWYGHIKYQIMPFSLFHAPTTFQVYIIKIPAKKLNVIVIIFLDDILVFTEDPSQAYIKAVWLILKKLRKYTLFVNLKKC